MHYRGLGSLRGRSVTPYLTACCCHRGHHFLLTASGITAPCGKPLPTSAQVESASDRKRAPAGRGEVLSPVPFPVPASLFRCGNQGCEERWDEDWASSGHWAVGVVISPWPRHLGMGKRGFGRVHRPVLTESGNAQNCRGGRKVFSRNPLLHF